MSPFLIYCLIGLAIIIIGGISGTHGTAGDIANIVLWIGKRLVYILIILIVLVFMGVIG